MNRFILLLLVFNPLICNSQTEENGWSPWEVSEANVYRYQTIVEFPEKSAIELFDAMVLWSSKTFRNSNYAVQLSDKENSTIVAKSSISYYAAAGITGCDCTLFFTLTTEFKDGRGRITLDDLLIADGSVKKSPSDYKKGFSMYKKYADAVIINSIDQSLRLVDQIKVELLKKDDW